jgi:hypothetical protein
MLGRKHRNPYPGPRFGKFWTQIFFNVANILALLAFYCILKFKMLCRVMDVFLSEGIEVIFRIALTLLMLGNPRFLKFKNL